MAETINISLKCGFDTDCTCASAAAIVGNNDGFSLMVKYDFYFSKLNMHLRIRKQGDDEYVLNIRKAVGSAGLDFLFFFVSVHQDAVDNEQRRAATKKLYSLLEENKNFNVHKMISFSEVASCDEVYRMFRKIWAGVRIDVLAKLKDEIIKKTRRE